MTEPAEIVMPRLSDTMQEGTILRWLVADGAHVERGEELVEIETDKASMTYASDLDGVLQVIVAEGDTVAVGVPIARVGANASATERAAPVAGRLAATLATADANATPTTAEPTDLRAPNGAPPDQKTLATPLARRAARVHDVALERLSGSGPRGRIVHADVLAAAGVARPATSAASRAVGPTATARPSTATVETALAGDVAPAVSNGSIKGATRRVPATRAQQLVARRMAEAKATIPDFQVQTDVVMDAAIAFRAELRAILEEGAPSLNDLIVKARADASAARSRTP
jgi:pyruvate dehydrogenase E2 component (dihydrolipoamide acetyltransferase)